MFYLLLSLCSSEKMWLISSHLQWQLNIENLKVTQDIKGVTLLHEEQCYCHKAVCKLFYYFIVIKIQPLPDCYLFFLETYKVKKRNPSPDFCLKLHNSLG